MRGWNSKGISAFGSEAYYWQSKVDPVTARHSENDIRDFAYYISANYCSDVW